MSRKRTHGKTRIFKSYRYMLQWGGWCQLASGTDSNGKEFGNGADFDEEAARVAWAEIGADLLVLYAKEYPGQMPMGWHWFDACDTPPGERYRPPLPENTSPFVRRLVELMEGAPRRGRVQ